MKTYLIALILFVGLDVAQAATLEEKLSAQELQYSEARDLLITHVRDVEVPIEARLITREDWEKVLTLQDDLAWTPDDLAALRAWQSERIRAARALSVKRSVIDLASFRSRDAARRFCERLPKGGMLHVHPWGTLGRDTVRTILETKNPLLSFQAILQGVASSSGELYPWEAAWLQGMGKDQTFLDLSPHDQRHYRDFMVLPPGKQPFPRFNAVFAFLATVIRGAEEYETAIMDFARRAVNQGVSYVEFTTETSADIYPLLEKVERETGLVIRLNHSFNRRLSPTELDTQLQALLEQAPSKWVVGIDFLDDEKGNSALDKGQLLYGGVLAAVLDGQATLHRTMHAGEIGDIRNPRDAMIMGAQRLGHAVNLAKDPVALEYAARHRIPVEVNLSSNLQLTDVASVARHPFLDYLRLGIPVSLSTDDEGIFDVDINHECEVAVSESDVTYDELKTMAFNSIATSFASTADKRLLAEKLNRAFSAFEAEH